ncbi:uncharacterized protein TRIREDRAFT_105748 [Trichoderma reesei QM6a]|uniref:Predicted protein n=2 Tax=Hypocrea jecorina TaxID=51453 RepID=G0REN9_HYPJQ|nr:uncharacterized protein TRIREDRAFT_105748 [Trichoderma reesei QM6a]EGR50272.1 predicted protein [Trichoderma reesei QM6a]ETR97171.1 hypothetical protein M419DRAFT_92291 [Trichoderma reesei RUT C-30]
MALAEKGNSSRLNVQLFPRNKMAWGRYLSSKQYSLQSETIKKLLLSLSSSLLNFDSKWAVSGTTSPYEALVAIYSISHLNCKVALLLLSSSGWDV